MPRPSPGGAEPDTSLPNPPALTTATHRSSWWLSPVLLLSVLVMVVPAASMMAAGAGTSPTSPPLPGSHTTLVALGGVYMPADLVLGAPLGPSANVAGSLQFATTNPAGEARVLAAQSDPTSPLYHEYLVGDQYDLLFGPNAAQQSALTSYLAQHQIITSVVSPFLWNVRGTAANMDAAFGTTFVLAWAPGSRVGYAPATPMTLPAGLASGVSATGAFQNAVPNAHSDRVPFTLPPQLKSLPRAQVATLHRPAQTDNLTLNITSPYMYYGYVASYGVYLAFPPTSLNLTYDLEMFNGTPPFQVNWNWGDGTVQNTVTNGPILPLPHVFSSPSQPAYSQAAQYDNITVTVTDANGTTVTFSVFMYLGMSPEEAQLFYDESPLLVRGDKGAGTSIGIDDMCDPTYPTAQYLTDLNAFSVAYGLPLLTNGSSFQIIGSGDNDWACANNGGGSEYWSGETLLDVEWSHAMAPEANIILDVSASAVDEGDAAWDTLSDGVYIDSNSWGCSYNVSLGEGCAYQPWNQAAAQGQSFLTASGDCGAPGMAGGYDEPTQNPTGVGVGGTEVFPYPSGVFKAEFAWNSTDDATCDETGANDDGSTGGFADNSGGWNASSVAAPWYQLILPSFTAFGAEAAYRGVPDVAAIGGTWVTYYYFGGWTVVAGTSLACPSWAGMLDLMYSYNDTGTKTNGLANYDLYLIANAPNYNTGFHDIVVGSNYDSGWGIGWSASAGWDPITGLGSPDVGKLAMFLAQQNGNPSPIGPLTVVLAANVTDVPAGSAINFGADATGGTPTLTGYSYAWTFGDTGTASTMAYQTTHVYTTPGNYVASVKVTVGSSSATSNLVDIHVYGPTPLTAFAAATPTSGYAPLDVAFSAAMLGGSGTASSWAWYLGPGQSAATQDAAFTFTSPGTYTTWVNVTDTAGHSAESNPVTIQVLLPLAITASASLTSGSAPLQVTFTSVTSGGAPPYTAYAWHFGDTTTGTTADPPVHTYSSPGTYYVWANVTDSAQHTAMSNVVVVKAVVPSLAISTFTATPSTVTLGSSSASTTFAVATTGGLAPLSYAYTGLPNGCTSSDTASFTCTPTASGTYTVTVTVMDSSSPAQSAQTTARLIVNPAVPALSVTIAGPAKATAGVPATYYANPTGGSGSYSTFVWTFSDIASTVNSGGTNQTSHTFDSAGTFTVTVKVTDSTGNAATSTSLSVTVSAAPSGSTSPTTSSGFLGVPTLDWVVVVAVLVAVAIVGALLATRRKKSPPPAETGAWPPPSGAGVAPYPGPAAPGTVEPPPPPGG